MQQSDFNTKESQLKPELIRRKAINYTFIRFEWNGGILDVNIIFHTGLTTPLYRANSWFTWRNSEGLSELLTS